MSSRPNFSICVYCGSREGSQPAFAYAAGEVGRWIGQHGGQLVYGGGNNGLMGIVAQATLDAGGIVKGIIPQKPGRARVCQNQLHRAARC
jgi:predicted Rossmann-fold nucleotide-binding protein